MQREISYEDVQGSLKTGDLLLFHGVEPSSKLIELVEWSYWSHVGMVIIPSDLGLDGSEPLFWESTSSSDGINDVILKKPKESGPMLVALSERIKMDLDNQYDTHFKVKYLNNPLTKNEIALLSGYISKTHDKVFPPDADLFKYFVEGRHFNAPMPDSEIFCSQLVAQSLMAMGYISDKYVANGYCPSDFDKGEGMPSLKSFFYIEGARLK